MTTPDGQANPQAPPPRGPAELALFLNGPMPMWLMDPATLEFVEYSIGEWEWPFNNPQNLFINLAMGGGMGAGQDTDGISGVQTHMTNTRNTPIEVMESSYPVRVHRYALRHHSGGAGQHRGGDGLIRELEFTDKTTITLLTERRSTRPWGLREGEDGQPGVNKINDKQMPPKFSTSVNKGDRLTIETAGGGGWGLKGNMGKQTNNKMES